MTNIMGTPMSKVNCCSNSYLVIVYLNAISYGNILDNNVPPVELQQLGESSFLFQQIASPVHKILNA